MIAATLGLSVANARAHNRFVPLETAAILHRETISFLAIIGIDMRLLLLLLRLFLFCVFLFIKLRLRSSLVARLNRARHGTRFETEKEKKKKKRTPL